MNLFQYLQKPHPFIFNRWSVILPGVITFLVIVLLAPFQFQEMTIVFRSVIALAFGCIISFAVLGTELIARRIAPNWFDEDSWTLSKEIALYIGVLLVITSLVFLVILLWVGNETSVAEIFTNVIVYTLTISLFPILILVLFEQYNYQKIQHRKARELSKFLESKVTRSKNSLLQFKAENGKIELQLSEEKVRYLKSDGNYVEVVYIDGSLQKKLIRNRLKVFAESLSESSFFQCHKSYIIHKNSIVRVEGNARNFELFLQDIPNSIPVARSKSEQLMQLFSARENSG